MVKMISNVSYLRLEVENTFQSLRLGEIVLNRYQKI